MAHDIRKILSALNKYEWLKSNTIGAKRWNAVLDGTAPPMRTVVSVDSNPMGGGAAHTMTQVQVPYITDSEVDEIVTVARKHGLLP